MGWGGMGSDGPSKGFLNFLYTLWVCRFCIYLLTYEIKKYHQHSYVFQNLMSSWGVGILFSKLL